ncbi:MAG: major facilitator superfamily protein [Microgenomates group bacterium LiPW_31]|nr:MAG: major facilitator superfamily protein [Microgenomates group bacterium LiPW_31]
MKKSPFFEVIKLTNFRRIWGSQIFSQVTLNFINFVIILRIFEATHSTVAVSLVWVFYAIPAILLGPFSGTIVDLFQKRKILMYTTFFEAFIVLCYLLVKHKLWPIYSVIFLYSLVNQLYIPAEASTLPWVVSKNLLPVANSFFLFTIYGAFLIGFGLAGPVVKLIGREVPFILGFLSLIIASLLVSNLSKEEGKKGKIRDIQDFWIKVKEGYLFIKSQPTILFPLLLLVFSQVIIGVIAVLSPSLATEILAIDLLDAGPALVLPAGFGAVIGVLGVTSLLRKKVRKKKIISFGLFLSAVSLLSIATVVPFLGNLRALVAMGIAFLLGIGLVSLIVPVQTLLQEKTPEDKRGRVFGVLGFAVTLASILPVLLTATIADILGVNFILGIIAIIIGAVWIYSLREPYEIFSYNRT